jgi:hypothetical protein
MSRIFIEKEQIEEINNFDLHEIFEQIADKDIESMTETEPEDWFGNQDDIFIHDTLYVVRRR